jgi:hypothetical protein
MQAALPIGARFPLSLSPPAPAIIINLLFETARTAEIILRKPSSVWRNRRIPLFRVRSEFLPTGGMDRRSLPNVEKTSDGLKPSIMSAAAESATFSRLCAPIKLVLRAKDSFVSLSTALALVPSIFSFASQT